ncbi:V-set domain-containing T-cell activation inhibitor 1-like [Salarias fasciatus]|uniref:V-set domain-containing T-cell activation inhibitor 1-like n=1 Tax=Salarias fasciatus TaxID=181472 RepID=UPI001176DC43|nr:V-set domain-containing T-cell activation inhibitor 1-like [Salarias fasciatus]
MKLLLLLLPLTWSGTSSAADGGPELFRVSVKEGSDVVLPCSLSNTDLEALLFDWKKDRHKEVFLYDAGPQYSHGRSGQDQQFRGRVSHFPTELKQGNASILITNTRVADSGNYSCGFPRLQPERQIFYIQLLVGVSPKPSVSTVDETKDWALLQCEIQGAFPQPSVVWQDADGNVLPSRDPEVTERDGRFYIILQTTVTKTGRYRCVATQEEFNHQTHAETYLHLSGAASKPSVTILKETKSWALLQCEVLGASPRPAVVWKDAAGNEVPSEDAEVTERGGSYDTVLQATVTRSDRYRCEASQEQHRSQAHIYVHISEFPIGLTVTAAVLGALVVGGVVLHIVLLHKGYRFKKGSHSAVSHSLNSLQLPDQQLKEALTE